MNTVSIVKHTGALRTMLFDVCQVKYGERFVRGRRIACGKCSAINRVPLNTSTIGSGNDDIRMEQLAARKFQKLGWFIGKRKIEHRCPECVRLVTKPFAVLEPLKTKEHTVPTISLVGVTAPVTDPPPQMTRDDRRVIFAKLNEVYQDERRGYALDWSDKRVAEDLGVPRAWVVEVREQNFGPDVNAEFMVAVQEGKQIVAQCTVLIDETKKLQMKQVAEVNALMARVTPLAAAMERIEKQLKGIEKAMVP